MNETTETLVPWGWDPYWQQVWDREAPIGEPGRVLVVHRGELSLRLPSTVVRGLWRPEAGSRDVDPPTVGDWCAVVAAEGDDLALVRRRLPRRSELARRSPGRAEVAQVLAANVDVALLVCGLDRSQGIRSIERLLTVALDGGAQPVIVLNKIDLCDDLDGARAAAAAAAPGFDIVAVSATRGDGLAGLADHLSEGKTFVLLGPSGVGKSSLINALAGREVAGTRAVRDGDRRGRHTTTGRALHRLPAGAIMVDTPGLRELATWIEGDGLRLAFDDIETLARGCRFNDCRHDDEPGCAVRDALLEGEIEARRFHRFLELTQEHESQQKRRAQRHGNSKRRFKDISLQVRRMHKGKGKP